MRSDLGMVERGQHFHHIAANPAHISAGAQVGQALERGGAADLGRTGAWRVGWVEEIDIERRKKCILHSAITLMLHRDA